MIGLWISVIFALVIKNNSVLSAKTREIDQEFLGKPIEEIFKLYGINEEDRHVCSTLNEKTNQLYGGIVCKYAASQKFGSAELLSGSSCSDMPLFDNYVPCTKCFVKKLKNASRKYMCVTNGPKKNHYYVTDCNSDKILSIIYVEVEPEIDFSQPKIFETFNRRFADDIFGVYTEENELNKSNKIGICSDSDQKANERKSICEKILKRVPISPHDKKNVSDLHQCKLIRLSRQIHIFHDMIRYYQKGQRVTSTKVTFKKTKPILLVKCAEQQNHHNYPAIYFLQPTENTEYYFVIIPRNENQYFVEMCLKI